MDDDRIPTQIWLEGQLRALEGRGYAYYILKRGEGNSGVVCAKIRFGWRVSLYLQERNIDGKLGWREISPKNNDGITVEEGWVDGYIARAGARDPDLWVVEIETRAPDFPLEGPVFK